MLQQMLERRKLHHITFKPELRTFFFFFEGGKMREVERGEDGLSAINFYWNDNLTEKGDDSQTYMCKSSPS